MYPREQSSADRQLLTPETGFVLLPLTPDCQNCSELFAHSSAALPNWRKTIPDMTRYLLPLIFIGPLAAQNVPPPADQQLAHDIYKQLIEVKSGYTTGATTPVAEAVAARLKAA